MARRLAVVLLALTISVAVYARGEEPAETVTFAKSWEAAVEEAKLLNVPIIVHSHGFY